MWASAMALARVPAALLLLALSCGKARAEAPRPRVDVVVRAPEETAGELTRALAAQHALPIELRVVPAPRANRAPLSSDGAAWNERLAEARQRYVEADFEGCLGGLPNDAELIALLARGQATLVARALLFRGACQEGRGAHVEAAAEARRLALWGLELPPDVGSVAPDVERLFVDSSREVRALARARLRVESVPSQLALALDGRALGCTTPCSVEALPGTHVLALSGDGIAPFSRTADVRVDGPALSLRPEPASPELARAQWTERYGALADIDSAASLRLLALALPAPRLVLLSLEPAGDRRLELRGAYAVGGAVAARARSDAVTVGAAPREALQLIEQLLVRGKTLAAPRPLWRNPWFWTAIATVGAAAVTATALALHEPEQRTEIRFQ